MSPRLDLVLDAALAAFLRYGVKRTAMEDIAREAGMSRSSLYQYVRSKEDAFARVRERMFARAVDQAAAAAGAHDGPVEQAVAVLAVKLRLVASVHRDSPHAREILAEHDRSTAPGQDALLAGLAGILTGVLAPPAAASPLSAQELAEVLLALTRGLEHDLDHPDRAERLLGETVRLLLGPLEETA
ncbi:helix-turn-helix domain-containing protein [Streptomyces sp. DSM 42041]|uniref:Helix-turn-helix domain-containing protein n=1 Tax=Streptomyces hazeniae TaxID=3075538 RepID=A0ABU2NS26_9ACTN|nr:helix-turn-helix domain-containing protein [Streptomyces sp. DSM 42041]MDT0379252.1 helix-turn-helix domain-containing protein [Streptomyces sp. DSM 42041]